MWKVRAGENQIAGFELANKVADEIAAARRNDQVKLIFRMKVPAHCPERITMRPCREGFAWSYLDDFQIRFHVASSRERRSSSLFP
jgi:hypothetical protein